MSLQFQNLPENGIHIRPVMESDLPILFEQQRDPEANEMAAFPARDYEPFMTHWTKILNDRTVVTMAVVVDGCVAGYVGCWTQEGQRLVGYWLGKEFWGRGIATQMMSMFLRMVTDRPLHAHVAKRNGASIRVLEKCGFTSSTETQEPDDGIGEWIYKLESGSNASCE